jgi:catechol 2,3-dioxygenase-like lactoylglutathione lyase family enzyme
VRAIWIEIPVADLARAKAFYESVFAYPATPVIVFALVVDSEGNALSLPAAS